MNKKTSYLINTAILIAIAGLGYLFTHAMYAQKPNVIIQPEAPVEEVENAQKTPEFTFQTLDKAQHNLRDYQGKIILLNFWATWCAPCVKEFPHLLQIANEYPDNIVLIALSSDIDKAAIDKFVQKFDLNISAQNVLIALDEDNITQSTFQTFKLPETILIDKNQNMRKKLIGADWEIEYLKNEIEKLL